MNLSDSNNGEAPPQKPSRLAVALAFGFAAGALFSRKPAAAVAAAATGLLTCLSSGRSKQCDDAIEGDEIDASEETNAAAPSETLPVQQRTEISSEASAPEPIDRLELSALDPLPEFGEIATTALPDRQDELALLSLPEIDAVHGGNGALPTKHLTVERTQEIEAELEPVSHLTGETEPFMPSKKRSWFRWW